MDFENRNVTPDGQEPAPQTNSEFRPPEPQPYAQPVQNPQDTAPMQTPYQAQVRGSDEAPQTAPPTQTPYQTPVRASDDAPVYHDEAYQPDAVQPPFEPGTQSYATFQQWQEQETLLKTVNLYINFPRLLKLKNTLKKSLKVSGMNISV